MEIKVTIGVTPSLEKILLDLTDVLPKATVSIDSQKVAEVLEENNHPTQQQPQAVPTQQAPVQQQQPQAVPTSAPTYSFDQLAVAATQLMDAGRMADLQQLLSSFGVQALMELPETQFGAFATKLRELGAKI